MPYRVQVLLVNGAYMTMGTHPSIEEALRELNVIVKFGCNISRTKRESCIQLEHIPVSAMVRVYAVEIPEAQILFEERGEISE